MPTIDNLPGHYSVGTASVEAGSVTVTPTDALWSGNVWGDDLFFLPSQPLVPPQRIREIADDGTATLAYPWPGADADNEPYEIRYVGTIERSTAQSRRVLEQLGDVKTWADIFVQTDADRLALDTPSNPLRSGLRVLVADDGAIWAKASGAYDDWIGPASFTGPRGIPGPFTSITFGPVTTLPAGADADADAVVIGPGQIRIDLSIPKGLDGTGTGDMVGPTDSEDDEIMVFSGTSGKLAKRGGSKIADIVPGDNSIDNAKLADMATARVKGRVTAGPGDPEDLTGAQARAIIGLTGSIRCGLFHAVDEKAQGTLSGASASGVNIRTLNTVKTNEIGASLASNRFTLLAGLYDIEAWAASIFGSRSRLYVVDVAALAVPILWSMSDYSTTVTADGDVGTKTFLQGRLNPAVTTTYELRHFLTSGYAGRGFGVETNAAGLPELFAEVRAWALK